MIRMGAADSGTVCTSFRIGARCTDSGDTKVSLARARAFFVPCRRAVPSHAQAAGWLDRHPTIPAPNPERRLSVRPVCRSTRPTPRFIGVFTDIALGCEAASEMPDCLQPSKNGSLWAVREPALRFANFGWSGTALNAIRPRHLHLSFSLCPLLRCFCFTQLCSNDAWPCRPPGHWCATSSGLRCVVRVHLATLVDP